MEALQQASGSQLDPAVVRAFLRCYSSNRAILAWSLLAVSPQRKQALDTGAIDILHASNGQVITEVRDGGPDKYSSDEITDFGETGYTLLHVTQDGSPLRQTP